MHETKDPTWAAFLLSMWEELTSVEPSSKSSAKLYIFPGDVNVPRYGDMFYGITTAPQ